MVNVSTVSSTLEGIICNPTKPYKAQVVSSSPSLTNGLSNPATTLSHNGQLLARTSSNSALSFSIFLPPSLSAPLFLPPIPIPGIQPTGADTIVASASGTMRSRKRSPAFKTLRPSDPAARVRSIRGLARFVNVADNSVRSFVGAVPLGFGAGIGCWFLTVSLTSSVCNRTIFRSAWAGRNSLACYAVRMMIYRHRKACLPNQSNSLRGMYVDKGRRRIVSLAVVVNRPNIVLLHQ